MKSTSNKNDAALATFVKQKMKATSVPGVAVGITHKGRRFVEGFGVNNVDHPSNVTADTLFQIGSTSKTFCATAAMKLVEQGKLDLDSPIRKYLKDFRLRNAETTKNATLLHCFTHTGGWLGDFFPNTGRGDDSLAKAVGLMNKIPHMTPLGEIFSYNNAGFYVAGRVIEKVTGKPYEVVIKEMLFEPLGMSDSFFLSDEIMTRHFVVGHLTQGKKSQTISGWAMPRTVGPAGGIISNAGDQLKWAEFHMGNGKTPSGKRLLKSSTLRFMRKHRVSARSLAAGVGISWLLRTIDDIQIVQHGGTTAGQLSAFVTVPEHNFAVTVLTNSTRGGELHRAAVEFALDKYLGLKTPKPKVVKVASAKLRDYAGTYKVESMGTHLNVAYQSGNLVVHQPTPRGLTGQKMPKPPPIPLAFFDEDRVFVPSGAARGTFGEFIRSSSGRVAWFSIGGRINRRVKA